MDPSSTESGHTNLVKARELRNQANQAMSGENYREALRLFHQCILMARAVEQTFSVAIHQNSMISADAAATADSSTSTTSTATTATLDPQPADLEAQKQPPAEAEKQTNEDAKHEAHELLAECYLNLANCVLNGGGQRNPEDYKRVIQYCTNVLSYEPTSEQKKDALLFKAIAFMKAENFNEALSALQDLPDNEQVQQLVEECLRLKSDQRRKRDEMIMANFAKQQQNNERNGFPDGHGMNGRALNGSIN